MLRIFWIYSFGLLLIACQSNFSRKLTIATAANMQFAMEALIVAFEEESGIECEMIVSSSGKLTAQIKEGAPFDLFVSADLKYPTVLFEANLTVEKPEIYAAGKLVLWSAKEETAISINDLSNPNIQHIALANPKTAPYGIAAIEVLTHYGLLESLKSKLVYGESITQTNQFISSGAASVGFTAKSVVLSPKLKGKGNWVALEDTLYTPINQAVVILKNEADRLEEAHQFYDFLFSETGKNILREFGYSTL